MAADFEVNAELVIKTQAAARGMEALSGRLANIAQGLRGAQSGGMGFVSSMLVTNAITAGMGALGAAVHHVTSGVLDLTTQMQGAQIGIATMVAGFQGISFQAAQDQASDLYRRIQTVAMASTATSSQLQDAFQTMYAGMASAGLDAGKQMEMLAGTATAAAAYMGNDMEQTSRDMSMIMGGLAGQQVKLWRPLQHLIGMSAEEWNEMAKADPSQAAARLQAVLGSDAMREAGQAYGRSLAGAMSTAEDYVEHFKRAAFTPIANAFGTQLNRMNDWLTAHREQLDAFFGNVGRGAAGLLERWSNAAAGRLAYVAAHWDEIMDKLANLYARAVALVPHVLAAAKAWMTVRVAMMAAAAAMSTASRAAAAAASIQQAAGFFREGGTFLGAGLAGAGAAGAGAAGAGGAAAAGTGVLASLQTVMAALAPLAAPLAAILAIVGGVVAFVSAQWQRFAGVFATLAPYFESIFADLMTFGEGLWSVLKPILEIVGGVIAWVASMFGGALLLALRGLSYILGRLGEVLKWIGAKIQWFANIAMDGFMTMIEFIANAIAELGSLMDVAIDVTALRNARRNLRQLFSTGPEATPGTQQAPTAPQTPERRVTNINGARITVNQEFREADPDRVAVRMIEDIARFAEQRVMSGLAPALTR